MLTRVSHRKGYNGHVIDPHDQEEDLQQRSTNPMQRNRNGTQVLSLTRPTCVNYHR